MKLHSLVRSKGLTDKLNRRWRGNASGRGNFSGRGCNGQKSRSGHSMKPFFEWGQTSVVMRMPKHRGFKRYYKLLTPVQTVNLDAIQKDEKITEVVSKEVLLHNYLIYRLFIVVFCDDIQTFANCFFSENCISVFIVHKILVPYSYYS